jgi:hypothetical protein
MLQIANSKALICTSPLEGFPNIFLEAWVCKIPVFSLYVDPGGIIQKRGIGFFANGNIGKLINELTYIENLNEITMKAKVYVENIHMLNDKKIKEIDTLFKEIASDELELSMMQ